jgi:class 3 adenylate cyclase
VGYGEVLMVDEDDFYGNELNLASKLGEDIADPGETLLTEAAHAQLRAEGTDLGVAVVARELTVSKMTMTAYALPAPK